MIKINNVSLKLDYTYHDLLSQASQSIGLGKEDIKSVDILKISVDSRRKSNVHFVCSLSIALKDQEYEDKILSKKRSFVSKYVPFEYTLHKINSNIKNPIVVGFGPAGMFASLILAMKGLNPLVIERGKTVGERIVDVEAMRKNGILNEESNVQFGEGGAGTFSDGKLNTGVNDNRGRFVLEELVRMGAPEDILINSSPHIGTDKLRDVVVNIREKIKSLGGRFLFKNKVTDILMKGDKVYAVEITNDLGVKNTLYTDAVIFAIGHSARDTIKLLYDKGVALSSKPFSVGVRIEHSKKMIDRAQYGKFAGHSRLGAASYKLSYHDSLGCGVYTFCMCPGGEVICSSSEKNMLVTNGMSNFKRDAKNSNSALLVSVFPNDFADDSPLAGIQFQRDLEYKAFLLGGKDYFAPVQTVQDFLKNQKTVCLGNISPSYTPGVTFANINDILPEFILHTIKEGIMAFGHKLKGFDRSDAILTAVETRSSSPVRILRDSDTFQSVNILGLYPIGEGAGYAGGIMSAAMDGIKCAEMF